MPPATPRPPEGLPNPRRPSPHVAKLLEALHLLFREALDHGFCRVAASAYAAQQQPHPPSDRLSPHQFQMGPHIGERPCTAQLCSCVSTANAQKPHRDRRKPIHSHQNHSTRQQQPTQQITPPRNSTPLIDDLRKEMQNLDDASKMALVRDRMMSPYKRSKTLELENNIRRLFEDQYKRITTTGAVVPPRTIQPNKPDQMLGCKHYARRCKLKAKCCGLFVSCRFCHDEAMSDDHDFDRFATEKVLCMLCITEQDVTPSCAKCETPFAHYFCKECRFYENTPGKQVYHCHRCHICRLGKGLDIDNFHCDNCDACVSLQTKPYHRCMSKALHSNCPVCRGYLFTSTEPVLFMRCGHTMHSKCFEDYTTGSYQCPLCMRSLTNMKEYFEQIDEVVQNEPMPEEYAHKRSNIFCSDCQTKSTVKYHFMYHKCANPDCKSYNTKVLDVFDEEDPLAADNDPKEQHQHQQDQTTDNLPASRRLQQGSPSSSRGFTDGENREASEYYSSDRRGSFPNLYVDSGEEVAQTDEGQFTQPPIESTV